MINALLGFMEGAAAKATAASSKLHNMVDGAATDLFGDKIGQMIMQPSSGGMSMGMSSSMGDTEDTALLVQDANSRAGIQNEAINYLQPTPAMSRFRIPNFPSYREPLPQTQPQPKQETESERILRENMERIKSGMPPPPQ
jgi:hypothetical protein